MWFSKNYSPVPLRWWRCDGARVDGEKTGGGGEAAEGDKPADVSLNGDELVDK